MAAPKVPPRIVHRPRAVPRARARSPLALEVISLANAVAAVAVAVYLLGAIIALASIDLLLALLEPWTHGVSLQALRPSDPVFRPTTFFIGLATFAAAAWLAAAATGRIYNQLIRR